MKIPSLWPFSWLWSGLLVSLACSALAGSPNRFSCGDIGQRTFFPVLPWDPLHGWNNSRRDPRPNGLESVAECHFNMAGFVLPQDLRRCEKLGLGAILLPPAEAFTNFQFFRQWRQLSPLQIDQRVAQMVRAGGASRAIKGYFITDEPGVTDFPALALAVAAVKKHAPGKLAYINLFPDYATLGAPDRSQLGTSNYTEYLERFVQEVQPQALSYDNYMVQFSGDLQDPAKAASYYHNLLEVRRVALKYHLPYLNIVCANQIRPGTPIPSPANLSFQAYTTLAAGYRGVTWYNYYGPGYKYTAIDAAGHKTLTWAYLQEVNAQVATLAPVLCDLTSTGVYFSPPGPVEHLPLLPGKLIDTVTCDAPLMVGEFRASRGAPYVMVVNLSLERSAPFRLQTRQPYATIQMISPVDGSTSPVNTQDALWLCAGQGVLLKLGT